MGEPASITADKDAEYLNYSLGETSTSPSAPVTPYAIKLVNGKVEAYGRSGASTTPSTPLFVPLLMPR
jgi:hypothetical protein